MHQLLRSDCPVGWTDLQSCFATPTVFLSKLSSFIKIWTMCYNLSLGYGSICIDLVPTVGSNSSCHWHGSRSELCVLFLIWWGLIWLEQSVYMMWFLSGRCLISLFSALLVLSDRCSTAVMKEFTPLVTADRPTQRDVIGAVKPRRRSRRNTENFLAILIGSHGKSPVMPHTRLHLPQSRFIA